jgi:hypothetical protein
MLISNPVKMMVDLKQYRLPRKIKKKLSSKFWLYPEDENGSSLMANPKYSQEHYNAIKKGIATEFPDPKTRKIRQKEQNEKLSKEIVVSDVLLKEYVNEIFAEEFRFASLNTLLNAKANPKAIIAYYNFINAYNLYKSGEESFGNICCASVDHARDLMRKKKK